MSLLKSQNLLINCLKKFLNNKINFFITLQLGTQTEIEQPIAKFSQQETVQVMTTSTLKFRIIQYN